MPFRFLILLLPFFWLPSPAQGDSKRVGLLRSMVDGGSLVDVVQRVGRVRSGTAAVLGASPRAVRVVVRLVNRPNGRGWR